MGRKLGQSQPSTQHKALFVKTLRSEAVDSPMQIFHSVRNEIINQICGGCGIKCLGVLLLLSFKKKKKKAEITLQGLIWPKAENASSASHVIVTRLVGRHHKTALVSSRSRYFWRPGLGWAGRPESMKDL